MRRYESESGGNFAKAAAEIAGFVNATGSDVRGFCAGPAHALLHAAALVQAGTFKNVVVTAGGCTAKLGMNAKDHVKKGLPVLEDAIAGFSALLSADGRRQSAALYGYSWISYHRNRFSAAECHFVSGDGAP